MKKKLFIFVLALSLMLSMVFPAFAEWSAQDEDWLWQETEGAGSDMVETEESAGAPPQSFDIYIQAGNNDPVLFASYTGTKLRQLAKTYNTGNKRLKYSSVSGTGFAGRVTTEYLALDDLISYVSEDVGTLCFEEGDYLIMGEDYTRDQSYIDDGFSREQLMGNWFSYEFINSDRYYFPNWNTNSESGAEKVPAVIGLKSYGGGSGMSDDLLDIYASSADYLWAYVLYFGQRSCGEMTYSSFIHGMEQAIFHYNEQAAVNDTISAFMKSKLDAANELLETTVIGESSDTVAEGKFWVTEKQYIALETARADASAAVTDDATNGGIYSAALELDKASKSFSDARQSGKKTGYFWYTDDPDADTYVISGREQLVELGQIVCGMGYDKSTGESIPQDSFAGKTIVLACDIDVEGYRVRIGNDEYAFEGIFDGCGYSISNIETSYGSLTYVGLFGNIGAKGVVKNFELYGNAGVTDSSSYIGGVAGLNAGTIENVRCFVTVEASGSDYTGGIAGSNTGTVRSCLFGGSAESAVGSNAGVVEGVLNISDCYLAGSNSEAGTIRGCISLDKGLALENTGSVHSSYTLSSEAFGSNTGTVSDVFLSGSSSAAGITGIAEPSGFESADVLAALNAYGSFKAADGGYPCLSWQQEYDVYFELFLDGKIITPAQAGEYMPVIRPSDPEDSEWSFGGWYSDSERTAEFDFNAPVTGVTNIYARWNDDAGNMVYILRINVIRHTDSGLKTDTSTFFHTAGTNYSHELEVFDRYAGEWTAVTGTMGASDNEIDVHFYRRGDLNMDGNINALDAMLVLRWLEGNGELSDWQQRLAVLDSGETVDDVDEATVWKILRYSVGAIIGL